MFLFNLAKFSLIIDTPSSESYRNYSVL